MPLDARGAGGLMLLKPYNVKYKTYDADHAFDKFQQDIEIKNKYLYQQLRKHMVVIIFLMALANIISMLVIALVFM